MEKVIHFTPQDIVNKKFKSGVKGYQALEVDQYLDMVIEDYQTYAREIERLKNEINSIKASSGGMVSENESLVKANAVLVEQKRRLEIENASMKSQLEGIRPGDSVTAENMDYIKKMRQYEKFLYDEGYNPNVLRSKKN